MKPKISIIIPVYNAQKHLRECLDSVVNQSFKDIEIICVNDGSTDNTKNILNEYSKDTRITIINQENQGQGSARNNALNIAKGDYIQFVDADDWIELETCEKLYKKAVKDNLDLLLFQAINYDQNNDKYYEDDYYNNSKLPHEFDNKTFTLDDISEYMFSIAVTPISKLYKRNIIEKYHIRFPTRTFFEDNPFHWEVFLASKKISIMRNHFYLRRRHDASTTSKFNDRFFETVNISNMVVNVFKKYNVFEKYEKQILNNKIGYLYQWYRNIEKEFKQKYMELLQNDFNKIKKDTKLYNKYTELLEENNKTFFLNIIKNESVDELELSIEKHKMKKQYEYDSYKIYLKEKELNEKIAKKEKSLEEKIAKKERSLEEEMAEMRRSLEEEVAKKEKFLEEEVAKKEKSLEEKYSKREKELNLMNILVDDRVKKLEQNKEKHLEKEDELLNLQKKLHKKENYLKNQITLHEKLLKTERESLTKLNKNLDLKIKKLESINLEKDKIIYSKDIEINKLKQFRENVLNSKSWKLTKPLRREKK